MDNTINLKAARALVARENASTQLFLWEAVLATHDALVAAGFPGLPDVHLERAKAVLLRAGKSDAGDFTDTELRAISVTGGARLWSEIVGTIYKNEPVIDDMGVFYVCLQQHIKQALYAPGTEGGRTLFRPVREEPKGDEVLDFMWGERVPYGAKRRDPMDGLVYTPINPQGVTLYEPHYPHLVPSEYKVVAVSEPGSGPPRWADLEDNHLFNVGDEFTDYSKTYVVLRTFTKQTDRRPPALIDDYYRLKE